MKMNIKGLVFVGFAAAVFAGAANAADKTVTSKTYVDGKIVQTLTDGDTTHAPSADKVRDELALKQDIHISDSESDHGKTLIVGDTGDITISDVTAAGQQQADWDETEATDPSYIVGKPTIANAATAIGDATGQGDDAKELPTTYAVQQYMKTNQADWDQADGDKPDYIENKPIIANTAAAIADATGVGADAKELPTTYAVQRYMVASQADWDETEATDPSYINGKPSFAQNNVAKTKDTNGVINFTDTVTTLNQGTADGTVSVTVGNADPINVAVKNVEVTTNMIQDIAANSTETTKYPSAKAVADYLSSGLVPYGTTCSATAPCALVFDGTTPTWELIQQ